MRAFWLLLAGSMATASAAAEEKAGPAARLHRLFEEAWENDLREDPVRASYLGDRRWNDRWPDLSAEGIARRHARDRQTLKELAAIDRTALSPADRVSHDLFEREVRLRVEEHAHRTWLVPLDMRSGIHTTHEMTGSLRFETEKDHQDWIERLRRFPTLMDQTIALLRQGAREGILQPKVVMGRVVGQLETGLALKDEESPYLSPFARIPASIPPPRREALAREGREAFASAVRPALERFRRFLAEEYVPAAPEEVGIWKWPRGEETYAFLARKFTTTEMTPKQIHETGLAEVERIRREMEAIREKVGFQGGLGEFFAHLRADPRFQHRTGEALLTAYRALAKRIDPLMVKVLRRLPRIPYGVEPIPDLTAPHTTAAYYMEPAADGSRPGNFYINLYKPETRPTYEMMALSLHEAVPGHHLQIALAMELDLPSFRRFGGYTAFVEGWALYAEHLGEELGLYDDPYSKFGQLTYEMWRAVRLVVDTGIHVFRWSRERAIRYFLDNAAKTEVDVVNEIDRYIGWPGQALAYKVGELKIKELRRRAEAKLGPRFDPRDFHEVLLQDGAVTLDVLEAKVNAWVER